MTDRLSTSCQLAVIPAAGKGERMDGGTRKQYLVLAGKTVLEHAVARLLASGVSNIVIPVSEDDEQWSQLGVAADERIHFVTGGKTRAASVLNGLNKLLECFSEDEWVMVHDAARPCVSVRDIVKLKAELVDSTIGGLLAVRISDTIKKESLHRPHTIEGTLDRAGLWRALTPQMFRLGLLVKAITHCLENGIANTDEASAVEILGYNPLLIEGSPENIKITWPGDLKLAEYYLDQLATDP